MLSTFFILEGLSCIAKNRDPNFRVREVNCIFQRSCAPINIVMHAARGSMGGKVIFVERDRF